jgi:hypothetical protein
MRVTAADVDENLEGVLEEIRLELNSPVPTLPSPRAGR